ncbi:MAG: UMP kinase [Candidatus Nanoarchaeia archaeon]|nr:UMP kinase [Candidatus Nanoarchaeia archaeon]
MKKIIVISLGGSLIVPDKIQVHLLQNFKNVLLKNTKKYKFVVVCGGGQTARTYIKGLEEENILKKEYLQGLLGIASTRLNARFMTYFFGREANQGMPNDMKDVENLLKIHDIVFCGALRYAPNETSDATSVKLARHFRTSFINLTNVSGLHDKNPLIYKNAKFIPEISHEEFYKLATQTKFKPGQHFILDQKAAKIIKKYKIPSYIIGPDLKNLDNLLNDRHFIGSVIF